MHRRFLTLAWALVCVAVAACHSETADDSHNAGLDAADGRQGDAPVDAHPQEEITYLPDPGPPASLLGPRCIARANGQPVTPYCISTALHSNGKTTHVFVNFCNRNGEEECNGSAPFYISLLLPLPAFSVSTVLEAIGGRVTLTSGGDIYTIAALPGRPIPIAYDIWLQPHEAIPEGYWKSRLTMAVPAVEPNKPPMTLTVEIN